MESRTAASLVAIGLSLGAAPPAQPPPDPRAILGAMADAAAKLSDCTLLLVKQERFVEDNALEPEEQLVMKWARPYEVYFKNVKGPNPGREVIWARGWNHDKLRVHKGSFPDLTLNLDIHGSWATEGTHHPIDETSLPDLVALILRNAGDGDPSSAVNVRWAGEESLWGRPCDRIEITCPKEETAYTLAKGETLWDVSARFRQSMYAILNYNGARGWTHAGDAKAGDVVRVPRYYGSRFQVWVDRALHLPIQVLVTDFEGNAYERYEYHDLKVNVGLTSRDFDPKNPAYRF